MCIVLERRMRVCGPRVLQWLTELDLETTVISIDGIGALVEDVQSAWLLLLHCVCSCELLVVSGALLREHFKDRSVGV